MTTIQYVMTAVSLAVASLLAAPPHAAAQSPGGAFADFDCDFDSLSAGFAPADYSCDFSTGLSGSFDVSCGFSHSDAATGVDASGSMDASCDVAPAGSYECDFSSSYDYQSPTVPSVSRSLDCNTMGTGEILRIDCGNAIPEEEIRALLSTINVTCGVPQNFQLILDKLIDAGDAETTAALVENMRGNVKTVSGLRGKGKVRHLLQKAARLTKRGRSEAAKKKVARAQALVDKRAASLAPEEGAKLCASSLFCF